jgi:hypothetical protein
MMANEKTAMENSLTYRIGHLALKMDDGTISDVERYIYQLYLREMRERLKRWRAEFIASSSSS